MLAYAIAFSDAASKTLILDASVDRELMRPNPIKQVLHSDLYILLPLLFRERETPIRNFRVSIRSISFFGGCLLFSHIISSIAHAPSVADAIVAMREVIGHVSQSLAEVSSYSLKLLNQDTTGLDELEEVRTYILNNPL
jgi:hypothetical protein